MPNTVGLMTEYVPKSLKSMFVSVMSSGFPVGGMLAVGLSIVSSRNPFIIITSFYG
ncbi:hypothetical protein [Neobacillus vireti]|uniref:hypothetical protein n=1 Tax=Neobacillus vireti TaxID=220686 RepID=UPI002FFD685C